MENIEQQESLPITQEQIKEFIWWYKKFSRKWRTVSVENLKTTFKSYENDGKKYINVNNKYFDATRTYDPIKGTISISHGRPNSNIGVLPEDWELDQKKLEHDLKWFKDCVPPFGERVKRMPERIKNVLSKK